MASPPPGLRIDEELSVAPSHPKSPTTTSDPFFLRDEGVNYDLGKHELKKLTASLVAAMGSTEDLPVYPGTAASGCFAGGFYSPTHYEYGDDLECGTWREGLEAIDNFDWGQSAPEGTHNQEEGVDEARPATPAVEASQLELYLSNGESQIVSHNTSPGIDHLTTETSANGESIQAEAETAAPISAPPCSPLQCEELSQPFLPPTTPPGPRKISEDLQESSSPCIKSPPAKATISLGTISSTIPSEATHSRSPTGFLPASSALPGDAAEPDSMSPYDMAVDKTLGAGAIQEAAEGARNPFAQFVATEEEATPSYIPDRAVTPSNTKMDLLVDSTQDEGRPKADGEFLEEAQVGLSSNAADETESNDRDSLFDGDDSEEAAQEQQTDGRQTEVVYPGPEAAEQVDIPAQASPLHARGIADQSSEDVANNAPIRPSSSKDDIAAQIVEQFDLKDREDPLPPPLEERVDDVSTAAEALVMLSNVAGPATGCGQTASSEINLEGDSKCGAVTKESSPKPPVQDKLHSGSPDVDSPDLGPQLLHQKVPERELSAGKTHVEDVQADEQNNEAGVDVEDHPDPVSQTMSPMPPSHKQSPTRDAVMDEQLPRPNDVDQGLSSQVTLFKDTQNVDKNVAAAEPEKVAAPSEETAIASSSNPTTWPKPPKLKIGQLFWNAASPLWRTGAKDDTNAVGDIPAASSSSPGDAKDQPQENHDAMHHSEADFHASSGENSRGPAESSDEPSLYVDASPVVPAFPGEEGTLSDIEEATPQPLLPGLEEHAAAASSSTIAPSSPAMASQDQSSPWLGELLEQELELPPSPYEAEPSTGELPGEASDPDPTPSEDTKACPKDNPDAEPVDALLSVPKQDTPHDAPEFALTSSKAPETLHSPVSPTFDLDEPFQTDAETKTPKTIPKKRTHSATINKTEAGPTAIAEYKAEEELEPEYKAPPKKRYKKRGSTLLSLQAPTAASHSQVNTKHVAPPKHQRGKKTTRQAVEEEVVDRDDTEATPQELEEEQEEAEGSPSAPTTHPTTSSLPRYWTLETSYGKRVTRGDATTGREGARANTSPVQGAVPPRDEQEKLVDADEDAPASRATLNTKAKKAGPAKIPAKPKPKPKPRTPPALPTHTPDAGSQRRKYGFRPPTGRKRKSADVDALDGAPPPPPLPAQRQTRLASAAQEERERMAEVERNVAKRTRGARKSAG
ncbi:hypothetical protein P171DRAFT_525346 [Karstenula rhodostoma CBS 690.94]|uniref:Uncharacterized protein n=1 Tax=Karstenula rhodostoma CBS 690.94 TaxID=1392251 RepID=A0A9P4U766_9PLEO|nr:hypothetical protein P171DRAFT_525346 [Karstenula rhodostoma CBS 690.94]